MPSASSSTKELQELIKLEYKRCMSSPVYFMKKYVKIQHAIRGSIFFNLYPFQEETLRDFSEYNFNIILKSRQMGISTLVASYALWLMIFNKDKNILVISLRQEVAKEIVTKVRFANDNLPHGQKIKCVEDAKLSLKYENGSQIRATATTTSSGVSLSVSLMIVDEAALINDAEELWTSALPTLSTGGKAILLSTPRGKGGFFHKMWTEAEESPNGKIGKNGFHPIKLPWDLHPERDKEWRRIEGEKMGDPKKASQEYDCDFLSSGETVVDPLIIEWFWKNRQKDPVEIRGIDRGLWIWQYPDYSRSYILSSDVARGDGSDYSACQVFDALTLDQVAEYKGHLGTKDFGNFLVALATEYNNALLIVERENVGWATIQAIIDRNYQNLFYSSSDLKYVDVQRQLRFNYDSDDKKLTPGFSTNVKTRPLIISNISLYFREEMLNGNGVKIYSKRTLSEIDTFVWNKGKAIAMEGYNDDLVISAGIGIWVRDTALKLRQEGMDLMRATLQHTDMNKSKLTPIYKSQGVQTGENSWKMTVGKNPQTGRRDEEDLKWLIS